ncbi:hypothetical protein Tco_0396459 [Tanacetum coccineum]
MIQYTPAALMPIVIHEDSHNKRHDPEEDEIETLMEIKKSAAKDKGKGKMDETESPRKMKQKERAQISKDEEVAQKLQEEVIADEDFVQRLQAGEKCREEDLPMKLVELVNQRKKFFAQQRVEAKRNKPITPTQQKDYMLNYIKNQEGGYSIKQLKSLSFEQLEVQTLERAGQEVLEKPVKRQKIGEASVIVPVEKLVIQPLQVRYPIIDWEVYSEDTRRDDLFKLWDLVKEKFSTTEPTDDKEKELWVELKKLFELDIDDILCKLQRSSIKQTDQDSKVFGSILNTEDLIQKLDDLKVNHKFRGGLLGIRGFYNLMLLVQVCAAAED